MSCGLWGLRTTHGLVRTAGMVSLHPSFDTATWLAREASVFERVAEVLLPAATFLPRRLVVLDDAAALADPVFAPELAAVAEAAAGLLELPVRHLTMVPDGARLEDWRRHYVTAGAREAWQLHGAWIESAQPTFGPAIGARWAAAAAVTEDAARAAWGAIETLQARIHSVIDARTIAIVPSAASLAPARDAQGAQVDAVRMRTLQITCIAGLGGLPQVSIPRATADGVPLGISLIGPPRSDAALIRLAVRIAALLDAQPR